jgi:hypothetical protein
MALALLASCVTEPVREPGRPGQPQPPPPETEEEKKLKVEIASQFEAWRDATVAGDVEKHYQGLTGHLLSHWMWGRLEDPGDRVIQMWVDKLPEPARKELEAWRKFHAQVKPERAEPLPETILRSKWLFQCYAEYFRLEFEDRRREMAVTEVKVVAVEGNGATVTVGLVGGNHSMLYSMILGPQGWLIDGVTKTRKQ